MPPPQDTNSAQVQITRGSAKVWKLTVIVTVLKCSTCTESFIFKHWLHIWRCPATMCTHHTNTKMFTSSQKVLNGVIWRKTETLTFPSGELINVQLKSMTWLSFLHSSEAVTWKSWMNYVWPLTVQWHCPSTQQTEVLPEDTIKQRSKQKKKKTEKEPSGCRDFLKHIFWSSECNRTEGEKRKVKKRVNESNELFT